MTRSFIASPWAAATCLVLAACAIPSTPSMSTAMTSPTSPAPTQASGSATSTFCLGRFLIDMPAGARLSGADYKYDFARVEKPKAMSREQFRQELDAKEDKLRTTKHEVDPSLLRSAMRPNADSRIFAFWSDKGAAGLVDVEGYRWIDGLRFFISDQAGTSPPKEGSVSRQELALNSMRDYLTRLRPRADTDIPTDPGYCFEGGFIANERWRNEEVNISFRLPEHPDAVVLVWIYPLASRKRDRLLLERMNSAAKQLGNLAGQVRVLRQGDRAIAGFQGQEYLAAGPNSGGLQGHMFKWETQGEGTLQEPAVSIEFQSSRRDAKGNPQRTTLGHEQAMALWDRIVGSFRLRPVSGAPAAKTSDAGPPPGPLGEQASTGQRCPQTGWWECDNPRQAQGDRRRFFHAGDTLPGVVVAGRPSVWQKLKGEVPTYSATTAWTLVAHDHPAAPEPGSP